MQDFSIPDPPVAEVRLVPSVGFAVVQPVSVPPARPPEIAEREEFDAARAADTPAALELFIARHPQSRWRPSAERRLRELQTPSPTRPSPD